MSHEQHKEQHSKRLHQKETHVAKQVKIAKAYGISVKEPHKLAKHNVLDCGTPNCPICSSPRKTNNERSIQERRFDQPQVHNE